MEAVAETPRRTEGVLVPRDKAAQARQNEPVRKLLREWLSDTSGYDEEAWPQVKQLIEDNRLSSRSRFDD